MVRFGLPNAVCKVMGQVSRHGHDSYADAQWSPTTLKSASVMKLLPSANRGIVGALRYLSAPNVLSKAPAIQAYAGTFMTSPDGSSFSISLLNVAETGLKESLLELLDAPGNARSWQTLTRHGGTDKLEPATTEDGSEESQYHLAQLDCGISQIFARLQAVIDSKSEVTRYDGIVGDDDCGTMLKRGAEGKHEQPHPHSHSSPP